MVEPEYITVKVGSLELPELVDWLDVHAPSWNSLPFTSWTKETLSEHLKTMAVPVHGHHCIPFTLNDVSELMILKLSWDVIIHHPVSQFSL